MPRKRKETNGMQDALGVDVAEVTKEAFSENVPLNEDGSVALEGELSADEVRKAGAVSAESVRYNKDIAKKIRLKQQGKPDIRWGELDAVHVFDNVRQVFPASMIQIYVQRTEPDQLDFRPFPMSSCKSPGDFYDHIVRMMHKQSPASRYTVRFKEANGSERGRGYLNIPDTTAEPLQSNKGPEMNPQQPFPPIPLPYGGFMYPGQPGYPYAQQPQQQQQPQYPFGYGAPPAAPAAPPVQPPPPPAPTDSPEILRLQQENARLQAMMQQQQQPPPMPYQQQPSHVDPQLYGSIATTYQELRETKEILRENQLQIASVLGEIAEMKRQEQLRAQHPVQQQQQPYVQVVQPPTQQQQQAPQPPPQPSVPPPVAQRGPVGFGAHVPMQMPQQPQMQQPYWAPPGQQYPEQYQQQQQQYPQQYQQPAPPQQWGQPQPYPAGAPPAAARGWSQPGMGAPPPQQAPQPGTPNWQQTVNETVSLVSGMTRAVSQLRAAVGANEPPQEEEEEEMPPHLAGMYGPPPSMPEKAPFRTMPLGMGEAAPVFAYNDDGSPNWAAIMMGNAPKLGKWMQELAGGVQKMGQMQQQAQAGMMGRPPNGALPYVMDTTAEDPQIPPKFRPQTAPPQVHQQQHQQQQQQPQQQQFSGVPGPIAQHRNGHAGPTSFMPSIDAVRAATGNAQS